jgi:hypothetical protein
MPYVPFLEARKARASQIIAPAEGAPVDEFGGAELDVSQEESLQSGQPTPGSAFEREFSTRLWCIECGAFPDLEFGDVTYKKGDSFFCLRCLSRA